MKVYLLLAFLIFQFGKLFSESIAELSEYPMFCKIAAMDDETFAHFKRNPSYQKILEHVTFKQGEEYLEIIEKEYPFLFQHLEKCHENDILGNPVTYFYGESIGWFSPTTLRYMKVAADLIQLFGDLSDKKIVEIGGGYGGQCKIISSITDFSAYLILDLPEVCLLMKKYLGDQGVTNSICMNNREIPEDGLYDLVISNYALSEISRDEQISYIKRVVNRSKMGYITWNNISAAFGIDSLSEQEFINMIQLSNRKIEILEERPSTAGNVIITWKEEVESNYPG